MSQHPDFTVDPWSLHETRLHLGLLAETESLFALSNGHIGLRGNLDEGEPHGLPGTYVNGVYELHPLPYAERSYGVPESGQAIMNVTNGKLIRLLVDDEPLDVRTGRLRAHDRVLDLRAGTLQRNVEWTSPAHRTVRVRSTRFVSFVHRSIVGISYEVEPVDGPAHVVVQSELVANEPLPGLGKDPRTGGLGDLSLVAEQSLVREDTALLIHRAPRSGIRVAAAMRHAIAGTPGTRMVAECSTDNARFVFTDWLEPGQRLCIVKLVAYACSSERTRPALEDQVSAALVGASQLGWERLLAEQRAYLDDFWARADVQIEGDSSLQQALRFALFQVLSAAARAEGSAIAAKGLTGTGYLGHSFWDSDIFVLPFLMVSVPQAAADMLRWRHSTLPIAKRRARDLGLAGAAFPWRTIRGEECSGYWPAGTAAYHINADIADATLRYVHVTGDVEFEREVAVELLVETARFWRSRGHFVSGGSFRIDGVTGPDEYSALADNNVYTNLMARRNLRGAASTCERFPAEARELSVTPEELAAWRSAADHMVIPYDERLGVHPQSEGFLEHEQWAFDLTPSDHYPLMLHYHYSELYRKQVVKQPDLVLAMVLCPDEFTDEQRQRNFDYYEAITVRDSSLSACVQAVVAAEVGHVRLALDYAAEATLMDLHDLEHNTRDGLHLASLAGAWVAFVCGFGGLRAQGPQLHFKPRLPEGLMGLSFSLVNEGLRLRVTVRPTSARYELHDGVEDDDALELEHYGERLTVTGRESVTRPIPPLPARAEPRQPRGREPRRRRAG